MKKYKAKSMAGAQRRVRELEKQVAAWREVAEKFHEERTLLAKLSAETPQFFNPLDVMEAKKIRDSILKPLNVVREPSRTHDVKQPKT